MAPCGLGSSRPAQTRSQDRFNTLMGILLEQDIAPAPQAHDVPLQADNVIDQHLFDEALRVEIGQQPRRKLFVAVGVLAGQDGRPTQQRIGPQDRRDRRSPRRCSAGWTGLLDVAAAHWQARRGGLARRLVHHLIGWAYGGPVVQTCRSPVHKAFAGVAMKKN